MKENLETENFSLWFPGHMRKSRYIISDNLKNIDIVYELLDARAPTATKNKAIEDMIKNKLRLIILGKVDLAEKDLTKMWVKKFKKEGIFSIPLNCKNYIQTKEIINISRMLLKELKLKKNKKNFSVKKFRAMVVGVPNVGKSTLINSLAGRKKAKTGNFPGVTKSKQWIVLDENIDLLDTPGNLSYEDRINEESCFILELLGSLKVGVFDEENVAFKLLNFLYKNRKDILEKVFGFENIDFSENLLEQYAKLKNMLQKGAIVDTKRAAEILIRKFREGEFGRVTLQMP